MAANAVRVGAPGAPPREAPATGPLASPGVARLVGFVPLAMFGALQWGALLTPKAPGRMLLGVVAAAGAGGLLLVTGRDRRHAVRAAGAIAATLGLIVLALLIAGVPLRLLGPRNWDELASGLAQGMESLPAITVPYRGIDEWVRIALIASGVALTGLAALIAFWPRPQARTPGRSLPAAIALGALFTIPIVEHAPTAPYLSGAVFCILLATFLWLERLRADQVGVGLACVLGATVAGGFIAPHLDGSSPWLDYEQIAEDLQPERAATFSWDHNYGPMTWPRDGREVLRIKAAHETYWKTVNLDEFDGLRWIDSGQIRTVTDTELKHREWVETIKVVDRGIRSPLFVGAGHMLRVLPGGPGAVSVEPGTFQTIRGPLTPGSSYQAIVYVPRPNDRQLRTAGTRYPDFTGDYLDMRLPAVNSRTDARAVRFAPYGSSRKADAAFANGFVSGGGEAAVEHSAYDRLYALAQSLKAQSQDAVRVRPGGPPAGAERGDVQRETAARARAAHGLHVRQPARLLPAVLGRDGPDAAHGRRPGARRVRLQPGPVRHEAQRVRRPRRRRPLVGRGVLPGHRVADVRPDALRLARALADLRRRAEQQHPRGGAAELRPRPGR